MAENKWISLGLKINLPSPKFQPGQKKKRAEPPPIPNRPMVRIRRNRPR